MTVEEKLRHTLMVKLPNTRMDHGLSQEQLSKLSGISINNIHYLENGRTRSPGILTLYAISKALEIKLTDLLPEEMQ